MSEIMQTVWGYQPAQAQVALIDKAIPELADDELLIRNHMIGINPVDWKFIHANPLAWQAAHIPGVDGAGVVAAVGAGVDGELLGARVAYHAALALDGSFAHYTVVKANRVMQLPESMDFATAASLPCPMLTAWQAFEKIPLRAQAKVLVAGLGAVNKILVQLLVRAGFVVEVLSNSLQADEAARLGVTTIYQQQSQLSAQYFAVFDANSGAHAAELVPYLKANGHLICIQDRVPQPVDAPFTRTISYHEIALGALHTYGDSEDWQALMQQGEAVMATIAAANLEVQAPTIFSYDQMPEALKHSEHSKQKTVVATMN